LGSFQKLLDISRENGVSFEELCVAAIGTTSETAGEPAAEPQVAEPQ
jgi:Domain of unknown function (DUF2610)